MAILPARRRRRSASQRQIAADLAAETPSAVTASGAVPRSPLARQRIRGGQLGPVIAQYQTPSYSQNLPAQSVTAAAEIMAGPSITERKKGIPAQPWQQESWELRNEIGEFRFSGDRVARAVSKCRLHGASRATGSDRNPIPVTEGIVYELCQELFSDLASTAQGMKRAAQHLAFNGESLLVVRQDEEGTTTWMPYSTRELIASTNGYKLSDGVESRDLEDSELVIRCWTPSPELSALPDAAARSVLPVARELKGLTEHTSAQIDSRLAGAGILIVPQSIEVLGGNWKAPVEGEYDDEGNYIGADGEEVIVDGDSPSSNAGGEFVDQLISSMVTPIKDRDSAAAIVPLVITVPDDVVDKIQHIKFESTLDPMAKDLREEAIKRVALGMDSAPEVLLGLGSSNHWSAWQVSEEEVTLVIAPMAATVCHAFTVGWLHPALQQLGVENWRDYQVWFDATDLQLRPDRSTDAQALYDKELLGSKAVLRENGFTETDKPSAEEREERLLRAAMNANPALVTAILAKLGINLDPTMVPADAATVGPAPASGEATPIVGDDPAPTDTGDRSIPERDTTAPAADPAVAP